jgi:very-short-patch-repair endonuclease
MRRTNSDSLLEEVLCMPDLEAMYEKASGIERRAILRQHYMEAMPEIMHQAKQNLSVWAVEPYAFNWGFNKNEQSLWGSIRRNLMVMYPEFPVLGWFVDFGNPFLRIAIEADSKKFHNREKDVERDRKLLQINWKTFRVSYCENVETPFEELGERILDGHEDEASREMKHWLLDTSDGVVDAICFFYFMSEEQQSERTKRFPEYRPLAVETLQKHRYVDFALPEVKHA